jgi:hypothetical protein
MDRGRGARSTVDRWWRGPKAPKRGSTLTRVWPPATPAHGSTPAGAQQQEGSTGSSAWASLGLGRRCGDRAMAGKRRRRESSVTAALVLRERGKSEMGRCGDPQWRGGQFIGPEGVRRGGEFSNGRRWELKRGERNKGL